MWIKGIDTLIQTDILKLVSVHEHGDKFRLYADTAVDEFDDEKDANAAKDWFYLLLTGEIEKEDWERGRTDLEARETVLERKKALERRALMLPKSSVNQDAYQGALSEGGIQFIEFYEEILAPDCEKFWTILRAFREEQIAMEWPAANAQRRLVEIFEEATGVEYVGELDTGG